MLLVRRLLIAVPRRNHHAFDAELHHRIEKLPHALRIGVIEEGRIGRDPVPPLQRRFDRPHRHLIDTVPADRQIMFVFQSVHVDAECEKLRGLILVKFSLHQNRIGAEIHIPLLRDQPTDNRGHLGMDHRFATGNTDDRGATLLRRRQALLRRESLIQHMIRVLNLSAAGTGQIATE